MEEKPEKNLGVQPLDSVLTELAIANRDLVGASDEQLTHKQVQKGRKGKRISLNIQNKICRALSKATGKQWDRKALFNYEP